jgi:hypothetical protein
MRSVTLPFDEIEPVISGHPVVMCFLTGEVEYWTDYEGAPYVKAIYVGRADRRGSVEITREHGALFQMMRDLFNTDEWTERAYEALRLEAAE